MATELVDASKLDACCTAEANTIRAKTGSSAQIAYDWANSKGFADAIAAIPTGGGTDYLAQRIQNQLTSYSNSDVTRIREYAFYGCSELTDIALPNVTQIDIAAFQGCSGLESVSFPKVTTVGNGILRGCSSLIFAWFPILATVQNGILYQCTQIETVEFPAATNIVQNAFYGASKLSVLILRNTTAASLGNVNAFSGTPFASGNAGGTLYVPQSLVSQYTQASNWSTILGYANNSITAIEGSQYENYYADGTPIT